MLQDMPSEARAPTLPARMSDRILIVVLVVPMVLSLGVGVWIGLGYPGLYDKYESPARSSTRTPFEMFVDWLVRRFG